MACLVELEKPTDFDTVAGFPGVPPLTLADFVRDGADTHWALLDRDERVAARCSLWWTSSLCHDGHQTGLIGHYAARDGAAARPLLEHACSALAAHGCT